MSGHPAVRGGRNLAEGFRVDAQLLTAPRWGTVLLTTYTIDVATTLGQVLRERIGGPRFDLWFRDKAKFDLRSDRLVVGVPNCFYQDWLQKKFADDVQQAAAALVGETLPVSFVIDPELFREQRRQETSATPAPAPEAPAPRAEPALASPTRSRLRKWRRLSDFVVGPNNRVAHAAAVGVVEDPASVPTPLVLHGPVGVGKSHLLEGIYLGLKEANPDARLSYFTAEEFTNRVLGAMQAQKQGAFRRQLRDCDALFVDDLQFLAKKTATQEEFLHTLETLQRDGRHVIVACDSHPRLTEIFLPELTDRLVGGAVWGLTTPDAATRAALVRAKAKRPLPNDAVEYLASKLRGNVRELEGALHAVEHLARVSGGAITLELVQGAVAETLRACVRHVRLDDVDRAVHTTLGLPAGTLQSRQRRWQSAYPRMLAIYLARKHTEATFSEVGRHFGQRNHSTAVAAEKKVRAWLASGESVLLGASKVSVAEVLERIEAELAR